MLRADRPRPSIAVPFLDLGALHAPLKDEILGAIGDLIDRSEFVIGPTVERFEQRFAGWCGTADAVGVASGLDALRYALAAVGVGAGDEVLVPANTFVATFEAVTQVGATPVPVDASPTDYNLDVDAAADAVTPRTRAIVPVHLYGQLADMRPLAELARRHDLAVVEDAAQAHGAVRDGVAAGELGTAAAFSFYAGKNLGAMGDAGAVATSDAALAARVRMLREHGQRAKYEHDVVGWTGRLDAFQAAVLLAKLPHLDDWNDARRAVAAAYADALAGVGDLVLPPVAPASDPVWHLYVVRTADPDGLADHLREHGVQTGRHYPQPPHLSRAYASLGYAAGSFPVAEAIARECLSLPIFPGLTEAQVGAVADAVAAFFGDA